MADDQTAVAEVAEIPPPSEVKATPLPFPEHYDPNLTTLHAANYERLASDAYAWKEKHNLTTADTNICVIPIDVQIFQFSGLPLQQGAAEAARKGVEWGYKWMHKIGMWAPTMETEAVHQIFHASFFVDENGKHPALGVKITEEELGTKWHANIAAIRAVYPDMDETKMDAGYMYLRQYLRWYTKSLGEQGRGMVVQPYQGQLGGIDHALLPALHEMIFFSEVARDFDRTTIVKGGNKLTQSFAPQGPDIKTDHLNRVLDHDGKARRSLEKLLSKYTYTIIFGFPSSSSVKAFGDQLIEQYKENPGLLGRIYFLKSCCAPSIPVVDATQTPPVTLVDNPKIAEDAFAAFAAAGMHVIEDENLPLDEWPGMDLLA